MEIANEEFRRFDTVIIDKNSKKVKRLNKSGRTRPPNFSHKTHYFSNSEFPRITSRFLNSAAKLTGFIFSTALLKPAVFAFSVAFLKDSVLAIFIPFALHLSINQY